MCFLHDEIRNKRSFFLNQELTAAIMSVFETCGCVRYGQGLNRKPEKGREGERKKEQGLFIPRTDHLDSVISDALFDDWIAGYKS